VPEKPPSPRATASRATTSDTSGKSLPVLASELWELVVTYAKQETVDPLKSLVNFLKFGFAGAVLLALGLVLLLLAGLRALQTETTPHLTGHLSWVPYGIVLVGCAVVAGIAVSRVGKGKR
jgi:hypothetical protein